MIVSTSQGNCSQGLVGPCLVMYLLEKIKGPIMKNMRKAFNFYSSYDEVIQDMNDKQIVLFVKSLLDVQFFRKHISEIKFEDKILSICWKGMKHSIHKQIEGYCNANKLKYDDLFDAYEAPYNPTPEAPYQDTPIQEEGQGQEKEQLITEQEERFEKVWKAYNVKTIAKGNKKKALDSYKKYIHNKSSKDIKLVLDLEAKKEYGIRHLSTIFNNFEEALEIANETLTEDIKEDKDRFERVIG